MNVTTQVSGMILSKQTIRLSTNRRVVSAGIYVKVYLQSVTIDKTVCRIDIRRQKKEKKRKEIETEAPQQQQQKQQQQVTITRLG